MFLFFGGGRGVLHNRYNFCLFYFCSNGRRKIGENKALQKIPNISYMNDSSSISVQFFYFQYWFIFPSQGFLIFLGQLSNSPHLRKLLNTKYNKHYKCSVLLFIHSYSFFGVKIDISRISDNDYMFRFVHIFY